MAKIFTRDDQIVDIRICARLSDVFDVFITFDRQTEVISFSEFSDVSQGNIQIHVCVSMFRISNPLDLIRSIYNSIYRNGNVIASVVAEITSASSFSEW